MSHRTLILLVLILLTGCAGAGARADTGVMIPEGARYPGVDLTCGSDADCAVKDVGNCCGYYPACVNRDSPTFPDRVKAECGKKGMAGVCGFPVIHGCSCVDRQCRPRNGGG